MICFDQPRHLVCRSILASLFALSVFVSSVALADDNDAKRALASDEFDRGVRWIDEGRCEVSPVGDKETCLKARAAFQRAFSIYPEGLGALRNLANVEKTLGLWASAARSYRELARRAPLDPKPARRGWAEIALRELATIQTLAARLVINTPETAPPQTTVSLDGAPIPAAAWRVPIEVDPGDHQLVVTAQGHKSFELTVSLSTSELRAVTVDLVEDPAAATPGPAVEPSKPTPAVASKATGDVPHHGWTEKRWPLLTIGTGAAITAVGFGFGVAAIVQKDRACHGGSICEPEPLSSGRTLGDICTVTVSAGLVTAATGAAWYFFGPSARPQPALGVLPSVATDRLGLTVSGRF